MLDAYLSIYIFSSYENMEMLIWMGIDSVERTISFWAHTGCSFPWKDMLLLASVLRANIDWTQVPTDKGEDPGVDGKQYNSPCFAKQLQKNATVTSKIPAVSDEIRRRLQALMGGLPLNPSHLLLA